LEVGSIASGLQRRMLSLGAKTKAVGPMKLILEGLCYSKAEKICHDSRCFNHKMLLRKGYLR
jgi:hypothetical protein